MKELFILSGVMMIILQYVSTYFLETYAEIIMGKAPRSLKFTFKRFNNEIGNGKVETGS